MAIAPALDEIETDIPKIKLVTDHEYSLHDDHDDDDAGEDFDPSFQRVTATRYYRGQGVLVAISELNMPNHWDDEAFDELCNHLVSSWNNAAAGTEDRATLAAKLKELVDNARAISTDGDGNLPYFAWQKVRAFCSEHIDAILAAVEAKDAPRVITKAQIEAAAKAGHDAHWGKGSFEEAGPNERDRHRAFAEAVLLHDRAGSVEDVDYKTEWEAAALARDEAGCPFMTPAEAIAHLAAENAELRKNQAAAPTA